MWSAPSFVHSLTIHSFTVTEHLLCGGECSRLWVKVSGPDPHEACILVRVMDNGHMSKSEKHV